MTRSTVRLFSAAMVGEMDALGAAQIPRERECIPKQSICVCVLLWPASEVQREAGKLQEDDKLLQ